MPGDKPTSHFTLMTPQEVVKATHVQGQEVLRFMGIARSREYWETVRDKCKEQGENFLYASMGRLPPGKSEPAPEPVFEHDFSNAEERVIVAEVNPHEEAFRRYSEHDARLSRSLHGLLKPGEGITIDEEGNEL